ncbi:MAG: spore protease YyaC [Firmicutes bacterium]|jgi:putative sporulation protein YyaC|nr:spore protease YyaC [Bacillota bacterium]
MHSLTLKTVPKTDLGLPVNIDPQAIGAHRNFVRLLVSLFNEFKDSFAQLLILGIGSDRSTGDSLGPLVGHHLEGLLCRHQKVTVMGTLSRPVHALNLEETQNLLAKDFDSAAILAIDACLGQKNKVGYLEIGRGSILPGAAVQKKLPPVGDFYITGVVNVGGFLDALILQSTRLGVVFPLAQFISRGIFKAVSTTEWLSPL